MGVLVYSDGQHNTAGSPVTAAEVLGQQGIPVFTVGMGSVNAPEDMAVTEVVAPETVFARDQAKGHIELRDTMRNGCEFELVIVSGERRVWSETFVADGRGKREFEYQFPVASLIEKYQAEHSVEGVGAHSVPLSLEVQVSPVASAAPSLNGSSEKDSGPGAKPPSSRDRQLEANDSKPLFIQAIAQPRKLLVIDSRPRWETRYLHNMFARDQLWQVNVLMNVVTSGGYGGSWKRGDDQEGSFPNSREELFSYESIYIGDVPRRMFEDEELQWLLEFVENRGGGIVFIDGQRGNLRDYIETPVGKLLPVRWLSAGEEGRGGDRPKMPIRLGLSSAGVEFAPLRFAPTGAENEEIWGRLRPPHWYAQVEALPGAEVLAHGEFPEAAPSPILVWRRIGAGKVLFSTTDELWRWRYNVADRYHQKFWTQICNWVGEQPFSVVGSRVSIGSDKLVYGQGEEATLRVRVRDEDGKPAAEGDYVAVVYDGGGKAAAEIALAADGNRGGIFRGKSGELEPGEYKIAVRPDYSLRNAAEFDARAPLIVKAASDSEFDELTLNEDLLRDIARSSGGQYFAEEESRNLVNLLESIDRKKVIPSQTVLWSSFWWFAAIVGMLTAEWVLRKRAGLV